MWVFLVIIHTLVKGIKAILLLFHEVLSVIVIKKMALGTFGVLDLSRILFTTILSVTVLKEALGVQYVVDHELFHILNQTSVTDVKNMVKYKYKNFWRKFYGQEGF